jgi:hypothetical protein
MLSTLLEAMKLSVLESAGHRGTHMIGHQILRRNRASSISDDAAAVSSPGQSMFLQALAPYGVASAQTSDVTVTGSRDSDTQPIM